MPPTKRPKIFLGGFDIQRAWMTGQFSRRKEDSFLNFEQAHQEWIASFSPDGSGSDEALCAFRDRHLSSAGTNRLRTTLQMKRTRASATAANESIAITNDTKELLNHLKETIQGCMADSPLLQTVIRHDQITKMALYLLLVNLEQEPNPEEIVRSLNELANKKGVD